MKTIVIKRALHKGVFRLFVLFDYDLELIGLIKKIEGAAWSQTRKGWHVEDTIENVQKINQLFKGVAEINFPDVIVKEEKIIPEKETSGLDKNTGIKEFAFSLDVTEKKLLLKMPKNEVDIAFIRLLKYSRWKAEMFRWEIPNYGSNLELLKQHFAGRLSEINFHNNSQQPGDENIKPTVNIRKAKPNTVVVEIVDSRHIVLYFPFDRQHVEKMKTIPYYYYNKDEKTWRFSYAENTLSEIKNYFSKFNYAFETNEITTKNKSNKEKKNYGNERKIPQEYLEKLTLVRYSENTIRTYTQAFTDFINYYATKELNEITQDDIKNYLLYLVEKRQISASFQNQVINSIKFYFEKVCGGRKIPYIEISRPLPEHKLPNVLSKEEVLAILKAPKNLKHKAMLALLYACGLRRSELLNLKPTDIDSKRQLLIVHQSKGNKDRLIPISEKTIEMLRKYYIDYKPKVWLFEGEKAGEPYSETSLQKVLKHSVFICGIKKPVSLHWLRHSFATHSLENGTDLRYIQDILGHRSSKTTEIYTHVTFKGLKNIKSPFDDMEI